MHSASENQNLADISLSNTVDAIVSCDSPFTDPRPPDTSLSHVKDGIDPGACNYMRWYLQLPRHVLRVGAFSRLHDLKQYLTFLADRSLRDIEAEAIHVKAGRALSARKQKKGRVLPEELHLSDYVIKVVIPKAIKSDPRKSPATMVRDLVELQQSGIAHQIRQLPQLSPSLLSLQALPRRH